MPVTVETNVPCANAAYAWDEFARVARYASRWSTPNAAACACEQLNVTGLSVEVPYSMAGETLLTIEAYREAGGRLAERIAERAESGYTDPV